jgi:hypothetical protein
LHTVLLNTQTSDAEWGWQWKWCHIGNAPHQKLRIVFKPW